ncbi:hypothetical protein JOD43_004479 [Pullulanibacillus pueri]|uniref:Uncharacterized protein n=1 Tax=Pullulanibacillus pueri TaxID=1437324 RepID=A0A8J2ZZV5_9BACL|nr:hypothetical protein [Pullulanibacillus pueri]MBM7684257.1 hypothetical protein [Pullulanibacillus pueri]GGH89120.1 hypothetical protein GCM10007096_42990 [Pullulanibacillus pueri]
MIRSVKSFIIVFVLVPSILGGALAFTIDLIPLIWNLITRKQLDLSIKHLILDFALGYLIYLLYIIYKSIRYKIKGEE